MTLERSLIISANSAGTGHPIDKLSQLELRERVRNANPIEEVLQDYIKLLPGGGNKFKACCPFHQEKSPSFIVSPDWQSYHCFGCQERGDVFSFLMKIDNLEFIEAFRILAERGGVSLPKFGGKQEESESYADRRRQLDLMERACCWFEAQLKTSVGEEARDYLMNRGFDPKTITDFRLGFAPAGWNNLTAIIQKSGVDKNSAVAMGLIRKSSNGDRHYDCYRNRIIFPIRNHQGKVVGFGGRILKGTEGEPKYINSPENALFQKGQLLYGSFEGRDAIRQQRSLLLMEGYTDVMMAHQKGFKTAVATLGTALTENNVDRLARLADHVTLLFDGDRAGKNAAIKATRLSVSKDIQISVALIEEGSDPCDELSSEEGAKCFDQRLEKKIPALEFVLNEFANDGNLEDSASSQQIAAKYFEFVEAMQSAIRQEQGLQQLAKKLDIGLSAVQMEFKRWLEPRKKRSAAKRARLNSQMGTQMGSQNLRPTKSPQISSRSADQENFKQSAAPHLNCEESRRLERASWSELGALDSPNSTEENVAFEQTGAQRLSNMQDFQQRPESRQKLQVEEESIILGALSLPERSEIYFQLYPPQLFRNPELRALASRIETCGGKYNVLDIENPSEKSMLLALEARLKADGFDDRLASQLLHGLLSQRLESWCVHLKTAFSQVSHLVKTDGRVNSTELVLLHQRIRVALDGLRRLVRSDWPTLVAETQKWLPEEQAIRELLDSAESQPELLDSTESQQGPLAISDKHQPTRG